MVIRQIMLSFKKGLIKWLREGKLGGLIFLTTVMLFVVSGDLINYTYEAVKSEKVKASLQEYMDFCTIIKNLIPNSYFRLGIFGFIILLWVAIFYIRYCCEDSTKKVKRIHIMGHSTLGKTQFKVDEKYSKTIELNVEELNLVEDMNKFNENNEELEYVINAQDRFIEKFKDKINNHDKYGYMGIAHTPLILRAGYKMGDETRFILFHKKRNKEYYEELSNIESYDPIKIEKKDIKDNCKELIVAISTTFPIEENHLEILEPQNKSILKFRTDELGFDVVINKKQIDEYVNNILHEVRSSVTKEGIDRIHMVISSSVAFTFALGQALSKHYDPEIIIYHYNRDNQKKYPWGISVFEEYRKCIVTS